MWVLPTGAGGIVFRHCRRTAVGAVSAARAASDDLRALLDKELSRLPRLAAKLRKRRNLS